MRPQTDNPGRFAAGAQVVVGPGAEVGVAMTVLSSRSHQPDRLLVAFEDVGGRTEAEALRGQRIFAPAGDVAPLPEGEYWESDLIGLEVVDGSGARLGVVTQVLGRAVQDLWEVASPAGLVLVPAVPAIVREVDLAGRRVVLDPPEGLFPSPA